MIHRHLEIEPDVAVEDLPAAAIVDLLQAGDLDDWRPIVDAIARNPYGEFSARVLRLVDAYPMYGTSSLFRAWVDRRRARAEGSESSTAPTSLTAFRRKLGLTQVGYSGMERGRTLIGVDVLLDVCRILGRPVTYFLGGVALEIDDVSQETREVMGLMENLLQRERGAILGYARFVAQESSKEFDQ